MAMLRDSGKRGASLFSQTFVEIMKTSMNK